MKFEFITDFTKEFGIDEGFGPNLDLYNNSNYWVIDNNKKLVRRKFSSIMYSRDKELSGKQSRNSREEREENEEIIEIVFKAKMG